MATVVITCFAIRFHDFKMDAECREDQRDYISRREKRWSMNSQRLEEIVAELMKPISDVRRSFDTDLSALLEEYLTEAGLRALEAGEDEDGDGDGQWEPGTGTGEVGPNFAELALLLQQSASIYGRKVDFLYQHVLSVSDSLHNNSVEESPDVASPPEGASEPRRKRGAVAGGAGGFTGIALQGCAGCAREAGGGRPPPTLPRLYLELEPRALAAGDAPLTDRAGEPIGLLEDFHVTWPLHRGLLTEYTPAAAPPPPPLRPLPLHMLQAAIEAAAPPAIEVAPTPPPPPDESPPSPPPSPAPPPHTPAAVTSRQQRKRKCGADFVLATTINLVISKEGARALSRRSEFSVCSAWLTCVVSRRRARLLRQRAAAYTAQRRTNRGFCGWSEEEAERAARAAREAAARLQPDATATATGAATATATGGCDSDDDGFFEQSSLGDSDTSRADDSLLHTPCAAEWADWQAGVLARAAASEGAGPDMRALANSILAAVPPAPAPPCSLAAVLRTRAAAPRDVSRLFLATLFLANAGAVELTAPPLAVGGVRVRATGGQGDAAAAVAAAAAVDMPPPVVS